MVVKSRMTIKESCRGVLRQAHVLQEEEKSHVRREGNATTLAYFIVETLVQNGI